MNMNMINSDNDSKSVSIHSKIDSDSDSESIQTPSSVSAVTANTPVYNWLLNCTKLYSKSISNNNNTLQLTNCALLLGYNGSAYSGLQLQPSYSSINTIEQELLIVLFTCGSISIDTINQLNWSRTARTDTGVHSIINIISVNLLIDTNNSSQQQLLNEINNLLPIDIRLFDIIPIDSKFNAKSDCITRNYSYIVPSYVFQLGNAITTNNNQPIASTAAAPATATASTTAISTTISNTELDSLLLLAESELYRINQHIESSIKSSVISNNNSNNINRTRVAKHSDLIQQRRLIKAIKNQDINRLKQLLAKSINNNNNNNNNNTNNSNNSELLLLSLTAESILQYRLSTDLYNNINRLCQYFIGRQSYHNFTSKKKLKYYTSNNSNSNNNTTNNQLYRIINKLSIESIFITNDIEYIEFTISGESFIYNQIRKIFGLIINCIRGTVNDSVIVNKSIFQSNYYYSIPTAPAIGLLLNSPIFINKYNTFIQQSINNNTDIIQQFKQNSIYNSICNTTVITDTDTDTVSTTVSVNIVNQFKKWLLCIHQQQQQPPLIDNNNNNNNTAFTILSKSNYKQLLWKNGLGYTNEIAIEPAESNFTTGEFGWRISSAKIEQSSAFSIFNNHNRILIILTGELNCIKIIHDDTAESIVLNPLVAYSFPGNINTRCELLLTLESPLIDLSIFVRKSIINPTVQIIEINSGSIYQWNTTIGDWNLIYNASNNNSNNNSNNSNSVMIDNTIVFQPGDSIINSPNQSKGLIELKCIAGIGKLIVITLNRITTTLDL